VSVIVTRSRHRGKSDRVRGQHLGSVDKGVNATAHLDSVSLVLPIEVVVQGKET
jgi:hypothetical protein